MKAEEKLSELMLGKEFSNKLEIIKVKLKEIESSYPDVFMDKEFESFYVMILPPQEFKFIFLNEKVNELPKCIIDQTFEMLDNVINKGIN